MVREQAKGLDVLNLFCYTGSFSVYAAAGDAKTVTSVDLSKTYINWAKRNMQYNKLYNDKKHDFVNDDVLEVIKDIQPNSFDLIVCDPPTFSNSKKMDATFDVQRDHVWLLKQLLKACNDGGYIYFSNNYRNFLLDKDNIPTPYIEDITSKTTPFDFQGRLHRSCFLLRK